MLNRIVICRRIVFGRVWRSYRFCLHTTIQYLSIICEQVCESLFRATRLLWLSFNDKIAYSRIILRYFNSNNANFTWYYYLWCCSIIIEKNTIPLYKKFNLLVCYMAEDDQLKIRYLNHNTFVTQSLRWIFSHICGRGAWQFSGGI